MFRTPYPRPEQFLDPGELVAEYLNAVLETPNTQLSWRHFREVFSAEWPGTMYQKQVYFLPLAINYIFEQRENYGEFFLGVVDFISMHSEQLSRDGLLGPTKKCVFDCLRKWTKSFEVVHYDKEACQDRGWGLEYNDIVSNCYSVIEILVQFAEKKTHGDWVDEFVEDLVKSPDDPLKSAWVIEIASQYPPTLRRRRPHLAKVLYDDSLLKLHAQRVLNRFVKNSPSPTYWTDVFNRLGI